MSDPILIAIDALRVEMRLRFSSLAAQQDLLEEILASKPFRAPRKRTKPITDATTLMLIDLASKDIGGVVRVAFENEPLNINKLTARACHFGGKGWVAARRQEDGSILLFKLKDPVRK